MIELGIVVAFAVFVAAMLWYKRANDRFSERVLGHDPSRSSDPREILRDSSQVLRAWQTPIGDPDTERGRRLNDHRFRVMAGLVLMIAVIPLAFELIGLVSPYFARGGPIGLLILALALVMLLYRCYGIAQALVAYGNGSSLDRRSLVTSVLGAGAVIAVLLVVLVISVR